MWLALTVLGTVVNTGCKLSVEEQRTRAVFFVACGLASS